MKHSEPEEPLVGPYWDGEEDREWANDLCRAYFRRRWGVFRELEGSVYGEWAFVMWDGEKGLRVVLDADVLFRGSDKWNDSPARIPA